MCSVFSSWARLTLRFENCMTRIGVAKVDPFENAPKRRHIPLDFCAEMILGTEGTMHGAAWISLSGPWPAMPQPLRENVYDLPQAWTIGTIDALASSVNASIGDAFERMLDLANASSMLLISKGTE
ncbi:hypothetical protein LZ554_008715 [Drepanopeziza brunnea f. sp. 'monogermtubi']|nr:hypothetical protein LZ554_008715 [Drepanopeziza brunnea f. sp. 'monogermtubi']